MEPRVRRAYGIVRNGDVRKSYQEHTYNVKSQTNGRVYTVNTKLHQSGRLCQCKGFKSGWDCQHIHSAELFEALELIDGLFERSSKLLTRVLWGIENSVKSGNLESCQIDNLACYSDNRRIGNQVKAIVALLSDKVSSEQEVVTVEVIEPEPVKTSWADEFINRLEARKAYNRSGREMVG